MKWKKGPSEFFSEKTFLVIKDDFEVLEKKGKQRGKSKTANTGTWPPKIKRAMPLYEDPERPKTANLEKPNVLDPDLVDKLDMSLLSKELLSDSVTRFRLSKTISGGTSSFPSSSRCRRNVTVAEQHQQSPKLTATTWCNGTAVRQKRRSFEQILDTRLCQIEITADSPRMQKQARMNGQDGVSTKKQRSDNRKLDDNNNRNGMAGKVSTLSTLKKINSRSAISSDLEVFTSPSTKSAPEPCKTCGRPDQPERFHSHPRGSQIKIKESPANVKGSRTSVPKSIQKPVALHFRSDKNKNKIEEVFTIQEAKGNGKTSLQGREKQSARPSSAPIKKGPKTITCYICAREFGTASFPIHEPRCMKKWERENNSLPASQRRPAPQRPEVEIDHSDWNAVAWEESQAQLVPCSKCGRTFLPERLPIHQRSCKATPKIIEPEKFENAGLEKQSINATRVGPPTVACQVCGRSFGTRSIKIHEPQCIKRWQIESDTSQRKLISRRKSEMIGTQENSFSISPSGDIQQKRTVTCYICGRDFGSSSIIIHEPQCLKKWHFENDKLPLNQRRKEPEKPEIIYINDPEKGNTVIDVTAMAEASWKSHLNQLVPCKRCGRTFNPDRVDIHERNCKGKR